MINIVPQKLYLKSANFLGVYPQFLNRGFHFCAIYLEVATLC